MGIELLWFATPVASCGNATRPSAIQIWLHVFFFCM